MDSADDTVVLDINVGGTYYSVSRQLLVSDKDSKLYEWFHAAPEQRSLPTDAQGRHFIDRDGALFRFILDALRQPNSDGAIPLPEDFSEWTRLRNEAEFYGLNAVINWLGAREGRRRTTQEMGYITIGYHGTFSFGRQGISADINFRKVMRILVCGRVSLCREVYGDTLNEGRDPDQFEDRYTARFFLKHGFLEQAFDALAANGFQLVASCGTGTNGPPVDMGAKSPQSSSEEDRWAHYNEFVFCRR
uniref:Potassium channel tetramerisation-type BTB domain-containing protein n=1 Tax=Plectus sambesii TaxID=2011161 RepID=A0A914UUB2_9BILA